MVAKQYRICEWKGIKRRFNGRLRNRSISDFRFQISDFNAGMTMIEMIAVMLIIGILAAVVIPKVGTLASTGPSVDGAARMVASDIRYAQEFAMTNRVSKRIDFVSGQSSYTFSPTSSLDPSGRLPSGVTINDNYIITFNSLGEPIQGGGQFVRVTAGGLTRTISVVNYTGKVNIS